MRLFSFDPCTQVISTQQRHQELLKPNQASAVQQCKGALICLCTSLKGEQTLYVCTIWMWEAIKGGLPPQPWHHGIISSRQSPRIAKNLTQLQLCSNIVRVHLYAYLPYWKVLKHCLDVHYGWGNQSQVVYSLNRDIMASFPLDSQPELPKSIYICSMWMWEAIKGGNQPQQWHHGIISIWQSPRIAKIWPSFSGVTV